MQQRRRNDWGFRNVRKFEQANSEDKGPARGTPRGMALELFEMTRPVVVAQRLARLTLGPEPLA